MGPVHTRPQGPEGNINIMLNLKLTQLLEEKKQKYFQAGEQLTIAPLALQGTPANNRKSCCSAAMWVDFTHFMLNDKRQTLDAGACLSGGGAVAWYMQSHGFNARHLKREKKR